ncbi:MAG: YraN family protein [Enterobacterales bacterium endosymbiont of Blomia tropicalis]|uniref:YraN family protein n=1 Tax=Mixta mediterraneensis TaxID=2758443 RepID=UPI0018762258|nr:YraN family protein [Mixta mediterraneensis]MBE5254114.1 YraN family protein [Mixta mediterraneensis]MDL4915295.1 YraN family protein [Mixta mediterraneensis]
MEPVSSGRNQTGQLNRRQIGAEHEQRARHHLERAGLKWVASNVYSRGGELDLIMRDGHCWVFVEVRYRRDARFGGALASVTRQKQHKLLRAAAFWLAQRGGSFETVNCRFDIIAITGTALEWLPNAFNTDV